MSDRERLLLLEELEAERFGNPEDDLMPKPRVRVPVLDEPESADMALLRQANERVAEERRMRQERYGRRRGGESRG